MSHRTFVPGRIEVLGKHTDYAGGSSLLLAVERSFTFESAPLDTDRIVITAVATAEELSYTLRRDGDVVRAIPDAATSRPGWARYVDGLLDRVLAEFGEAARGATVRFTSDLPVAAGLSSSSALVTGVFLALDAVCRFRDLAAFRREIPGRQALAGWLSAAEMGGPVGTRGGSEDHVAILCAEAGRVVRYRLAPILSRGAVAIPEGWTFAVAASGVTADKGGAVQAQYNRLSDLAALAAQAWAAGTGANDVAHLGDALDRHTGDAAAFLAAIRSGASAVGSGGAAIRSGGAAVHADAAAIVRRASHFVEECALVDAAFEALERGDIVAFALAANRSAAVGAELLENQVPETLQLTALARDLGAIAASPFGGGFGGAVWALVRDERVDTFIAAWQDHYATVFPDRTAAHFFATHAAGPAAEIERT